MNALTRRVDVVDEHFGQRIADPYRWLEADPRSDTEMAAWVSAQNRLTQAHLASCRGATCCAGDLPACSTTRASPRR